MWLSVRTNVPLSSVWLYCLSVRPFFYPFFCTFPFVCLHSTLIVSVVLLTWHSSKCCEYFSFYQFYRCWIMSGCQYKYLPRAVATTNTYVVLSVCLSVFQNVCRFVFCFFFRNGRLRKCHSCILKFTVSLVCLFLLKKKSGCINSSTVGRLSLRFYFFDRLTVFQLHC